MPCLVIVYFPGNINLFSCLQEWFTGVFFYIICDNIGLKETRIELHKHEQNGVESMSYGWNQPIIILS